MCGKCCGPWCARCGGLSRMAARGMCTDERETPKGVACHLPGNDHREGAGERRTRAMKKAPPTLCRAVGSDGEELVDIRGALTIIASDQPTHPAEGAQVVEDICGVSSGPAPRRLPP